MVSGQISEEDIFPLQLVNFPHGAGYIDTQHWEEDNQPE